MREPVVASDGHTYERAAIEKWLKAHQISPRNGEPISTLTIPNINLKKLIQDIIDEGGAGFYIDDIINKDRTFEVRAEKVLILECLGPPESEWNNQAFQVYRNGCMGGRKVNPGEALTKDTIAFKDITVSRRHFEIYQSMDVNGLNTHFIRDLGSAGGTFIRIAPGLRKQLNPGMIVLLGKHQFTVSSIDDVRNTIIPSTTTTADAPHDIIPVDQASSIEVSGGYNGSVTEKSQSKFIVDDEFCKNEELALSSKLQDLSIQNATLDDLGLDETGLLLPLGAEAKQSQSNNYQDNNYQDNNNNNNNISASRFSTRRCTITCCAPDGSPLQGTSYAIDRHGAGLGRKVSNTIPLYMKVKDEKGESRVINVDTAISSEHARIEFEETTGKFYICDGTPTKPSTNGTWYRLSGPHQESPPYIIKKGMEVLIGTVRFEVKESMTIAEHGVDSRSTPSSLSADNKS